MRHCDDAELDSTFLTAERQMEAWSGFTCNVSGLVPTEMVDYWANIACQAQAEILRRAFC